jgi:hypothetical protein
VFQLKMLETFVGVGGEPRCIADHDGGAHRQTNFIHQAQRKQLPIEMRPTFHENVASGQASDRCAKINPTLAKSFDVSR